MILFLVCSFSTGVALLSRLLIQNFCSLESMLSIRALIGKKMMYTVKFNLVLLEAVNPCQHPNSVFSLVVNPSSRLIWIGTRVYCQWKERNRLLKWDFFLFTGSKPLPAANFFLLTWGNFSVFTVVLIGSKLVMVKT